LSCLLFLNFKEIQSKNFALPNERLTKHFTCIYVNSNKPTIIESIFHPTIKNWLEEFPLESIPYPIEMAEAVIKSLVEVYNDIKENLRPTPSKPFYLFNMRDVAKVVQGLQLVASRSKLKPKHKHSRFLYRYPSYVTQA
jgi:dynein heavy chain, axonemal